MRRFYLSPMVQHPVNGRWQPKVQRTFAGLAGAGVVCVVPDNPSAPGARALCLVDAPDQTPGVNDADNDALPDLTLDATLGSLSGAMRNALVNRLQSRGFDTTGINAQTAFRRVLRAIGRRYQTDFDENGFDVNPAG